MTRATPAIDIVDATAFTVAAWKEIFGRVLPLNQDFYLDGGTKEQARAFCASLQAFTGRPVPLRLFNRYPTQVDILHAIYPTSVPGVTVLNGTGTKTPLFIVTGAGGVGLRFTELARHLGPDQPLYVIENRGALRSGAFEWSYAAQCRRLVRLIRRVRPTGPYLVGGHSLGALVALLVVDELARQGSDVGLYVCFDGRMPEALAPQAPPHRKVGTHARPPREIAGMLLQSIGRTFRTGALPWRGYPGHFLRYQLGLRRQVQLRALPQWHGRALVFVSLRDPDFMHAAWPSFLCGPRRFVDVRSDHLGFLSKPETAENLAQEIASVKNSTVREG